MSFKRLLSGLLALALLSACDPGGTTSGSVPNVFTDRVQNYSGTGADLEVLVVDLLQGAGSGTLSSSGAFALSLGTPPAGLPRVADLLVASPLETDHGNALIADNVIITGDSGFLIPASRAETARSAIDLVEVELQPGDAVGRLVYVDNPVRIHGQVFDDGLSISVDMRLQEGWNLVVQRVTSVTGTTVNVRARAEGLKDSGLRWFYVD